MYGISALAAGLFWDSEEIVLVMDASLDEVWGYYDESGRYDRAGNLVNMTLGGCVSVLGKWQELERAWKAVLDREGLDAFHMTDFEAWQPPFDFKLPDGSRDHERHKSLLNRLLGLMVDHVEGFHAFSAVSAVPPGANAHKHMLEDCVIGAISYAVQETWRTYGRPINLVFAKQTHFGRGGIEKYLWLYNFGDARDRIKGLTQSEPRDVRPLQAADILAYEMCRVQREEAPQRYPARFLIEGAKARSRPATIKWGPLSSGERTFSPAVGG